ncbi:Hyalin (Fragment) [Seminavis robusta]|uniref:Hyalin n=1 Tax=Seminavis robusta TaxID=568900 RepID=A0A9N8DGY8_9STRA
MTISLTNLLVLLLALRPSMASRVRLRSLMAFNCRQLNCDDGRAETIDTCDGDVGCIHTECIGPDECQVFDYIETHGSETTDDDECVFKAKICDDGDSNTVDTCDPSSGCIHTACNDPNDVCSVGTIQGNVCVVTAVDCNDSDPLTIDTCDSSAGCVHTSCDDQNACTEDSINDNGTPEDPNDDYCVNEAISCDDQNPLTIDTCDTEFGCEYVCEDNDACTVDSWDNNACSFVPVNCDSGDPIAIDSCDPSTGCVHQCDDQDACTTEYWDPSSETCQVSPVDCDDGDPNTIDSCDPSTGCVHICDDQDACTQESFDSDGNCVPTLIDCNDGDTQTIDTCDPQSGCRFIPVDPDLDFDALALPDLYVYPSQDPSFPRGGGVETAILNWIKDKIEQDRTPYCFRDKYFRGWGEALSGCPSGKERIGALCYSHCPSGFHRFGFDCHQHCKTGWIDDGIYCRRGAPYGRGVGQILSGCESAYGQGNCEYDWGLWYQKCDPGFHPSGCCICSPDVPNCEAEGYSPWWPVLSSCRIHIHIGDPTSMICRHGTVQDGGLCYPPCIGGFVGVGHFCWQLCDHGEANCGIGCADSQDTCTIETANQIVAPIVVAANIATLGMSSAGSAAGRVGIAMFGKFFGSTTRAGKAMLRFAQRLNRFSDNVEDLLKAKVAIRTVKGTIQNIDFSLDVSTIHYYAMENYLAIFQYDFAAMTAQDISDEIDARLSENDASYIKRRWAQNMLMEMAENEGWDNGDMHLETLQTIAQFEPTGIYGLIDAYSKPICKGAIRFPTLFTVGGADGPILSLSPNSPPEARCKDVSLSADSSCQAGPGVEVIDDSSFDPEGARIDLSLSPEGPFGIGETTVTLTVVDDKGAQDDCTAKITVVDDTPPTITCPAVDLVNNTVGLCSASVTFETPLGEDNCGSSTTQTGGLASGSTFPVGSTLNTFEVIDGVSLQDSCSFSVTVLDVEAPTISCSDLATVQGNDPGLCAALYQYSPPVGQDNCEGTLTDQDIGPSLDVDNPFFFPVGTTANRFQASDSNGNFATCGFDVTIEDREDPVITCPAETIRVCDDVDPSETGEPISADNCEVTDVSYSDDTDDGIAGDCPEINIRTWVAQDEAQNSASCTQKIVEIPSKPDSVASGSLCLFDTDLGSVNQQFHTVFLREGNNNGNPPQEDSDGFNFPYYHFGASNPGQFTYNIFHFGTAGDSATFQLEIPYPFVTKDVSSPIQAFDWLDLAAEEVDGPACFVQDGNQPFFEDSTEITLDDYSTRECGSTKSVQVSMVIPSTGFVHLVVRLVLGLTEHDLPDQASSTAVDATSGELVLRNHCDMTFSMIGPDLQSSSTTLENTNVYQDNPGVAGFVLDELQHPVVGVTVSLTSGGSEVGNGVTDEDGFYQIAYQHRGQPADYVLALDSPSVSQTVSLQNNNYEVVNFSV